MVNNQVLKEFLKKPFQRTSLNCAPYTYKRLNLGLEQTPIYNAIMPIPKTPIFHPYNPTGTTKEQMKDGTGGIPGAILSVKFDNEVLQYLPESIKKIIIDNKIAKENIDCFFVPQNMPWKNEPLLIRPNYWLHGDKKLHDEAVKAHTLNATTPCRVGIFSATTANITIDNTKEALTANFLNYVTHPGKDETGKPISIVSPDKIGVMAGIDLNRTDSLYSVVLSGNRLAITLHWLLDDEDQNLLTNMSHYVRNLEELIETIQTLPNSRLNEKNGPLSHLQQILNVDAQKLNPRDQKDHKHNVAHTGKAHASNENVNVEDPKIQQEILRQVQEDAAKRKEQETLLNAFALKKEHDLKQAQEFLKLSEQAKFISFYEDQISKLKQKQTRNNKAMNALIDLMPDHKEKSKDKEKSEDMEILLKMACQVSNLIHLQLSLHEDPTKRDQSTLDSLMQSMAYLDKRVGELEDVIKNLKVLSAAAEQKPIAGANANHRMK